MRCILKANRNREPGKLGTDTVGVVIPSSRNRNSCMNLSLINNFQQLQTLYLAQS